MKKINYIGFICVILLLSNPAFSQVTFSKRHEKELRKFMHYIEFDALSLPYKSCKIKFEKIGYASFFTLPEYKKLWKEGINYIFDNEELQTIFKYIKDTSDFNISNINNCACASSLANDYYKLNELKFNIEHYLYGDTNKINIYNLNPLEIDITNEYIKSDSNRIKIIWKSIDEYNYTVKSIKQYINGMIKSKVFKYSMPIFLKHYTFCVFTYSDLDFGYINIYKKDKSKWQFYKAVMKFKLMNRLY